MLAHRRKRHRGDASAFTLVELTVGLAIVGVLAAMGGSRYQSYLDRARMARAIVELRGIAAQIEPMGDEHAILPSSLAMVGISTLDPWGNPYQYLLLQGNLPPGMAGSPPGLPAVAAGSPNTQPGNGGGGGPSAIELARKDRFLVPINSDFDLYSMGPDGRSKATLNAPESRDDLIRAADGAYYGLAEKF